MPTAAFELTLRSEDLFLGGRFQDHPDLIILQK